MKKKRVKKLLMFAGAIHRKKYKKKDILKLYKALSELQDFLQRPSGLPIELVLVRHGESEGNVAVKKSKKGDHSHFEDPEFASRHSKTYLLTDLGAAQAQQAGEWLKENGLDSFDHYYVSPYHRTRQTAKLLNLPKAKWHRPKVILRERDRGRADVISVKALKENFAYVPKGEDQEPYLFRFPDGESLADVELRIRHILKTMEREAAGKRVIVVCHGEVMWCFRMVLEGLSLDEFYTLINSKKTHDKILNCQILHYRRGLTKKGKQSKTFTEMRSICPWDMSKSRNEWTPIVRKLLSNEDLVMGIG